jgi:DNA-binding transcriptional regulator YiaG
VSSLQDCLKPESSAELFMQELRITISQIQAWWENRNRRPDGEELLLLLELM